jgi:hypothetical protein
MDGISFDPTGTITVEDGDDRWVIGRPRLRHVRYFDEGLNRLRKQWQERANQYRELLDQLSAGEELSAAKQRKIKAELEAWTVDNDRPGWEDVVPWLAEVFRQLADRPLPDDPDDWPAWLATDMSLPGQIVNHWKTAPKASGGQAPS